MKSKLSRLDLEVRAWKFVKIGKIEKVSAGLKEVM
jgi:uncharacterized membrane protein